VTIVLGLGFVVRFGVDWEVVFGSWCGRFLSRLVGEVLEGAGVRIPHNARVKPFSVSPIFDVGGRVMNRLVPGSAYWFRVSFLCDLVDCGRVVNAFVRDRYVLSSGEVVRVFGVEVGEFRLNSGDVGGRAVVNWGVEFWPTVFTFRSRYITWPSPARFLSSAARTLAYLVRGSEVVLDRGGDRLGGVIDSVDVKGFVRDLVFNTEVVGFRVRRLRVNLGGGRVMPAFRGVAEYVTYTENVGLFNALLDVAEFFGVGKNRALGLGFVKITHRDIKPL
jgi:CRISPR-associated endoribonuclease Cas6